METPPPVAVVGTVHKCWEVIGNIEQSSENVKFIEATRYRKTRIENEIESLIHMTVSVIILSRFSIE